MHGTGPPTVRSDLDVAALVLRPEPPPGGGSPPGGDGPHRVNRQVYVSPAVFEAEMDAIFAHTWVYVGHESEVPVPGAFTSTTIGRQPVILTRTDEGEVAVLLNRCTHRAATVCQERRGQNRFFRCPYHGWSFRPDGTLVNFTFAEGYDDPELSIDDFTLARPPRVDSYRGFVFASLAPDGPTLVEHLGNAAPYIDLLVDLSPTGRLSLGAPGESRYSYPGNWKIQSENGVDGYHANFVHLAFLEGAAPDNKALRMFTGGSPCRSVDLGNGHGLLDQRAVLSDSFERRSAATPQGRSHRAALQDSLGPNRAREVIRTSGGLGFNLLVFPNLLFIQYHARVVQPRSVDRTDVVLFPILFDAAGGDEAAQELCAHLNGERLRGHESFYGPAGGGVPGDLEMFRRVQEGLAVESVEWLSFERGRRRETLGPNGTRIGQVTDEGPQRSFYRRWLAELSR
jgi:phenylpropionate dioxygenase-like ring-hydroxylating dioxygenase large terminal subunit